MSNPPLPYRYAPTALSLALLGESVLIPWFVSNSLNLQPFLAWLCVLIVLGMSLWLPTAFEKQPRFAVPAALVAIPTLLAITSVLSAGHTSFDAAARLVTALTAGLYFVSVFFRQNTQAPRYGLTVRPLTDVRVASRPPLATPALVLLAAASFFLAVIAPALISATRRAPATNNYSIALHRAQDAVVHGMALAIAILVALVAGSRLLRGRGIRQSRRARALAWIIWALAFSALWWWFARVS